MKLQVNISDDLLSRIDYLSKEIGLSRSAFCNMLIADGVRARECSHMSSEFIKNYFRGSAQSSSPACPLV